MLLHRSHFGSRCRSGFGFAAGLFSANCLPCSALGLPLAGARCHRPWFRCRPLFGKLLDVTVAILAQGTDQALALLPASFRAFCCLLPWCHLLLELDVTVAILAQGADQGIGFAAASCWAFCCLLPCSALGPPLAGARCHRSHFGLRYRSPASFRAFCCLLPCSALGPPLAGARCHRSHCGSRYKSIRPWFCCRPLFVLSSSL